MTPQVALLIGTPANARLLAHGAWSPLALVAVADVSAAFAWLATASKTPALVAIAHSWPGEIDLVEVERLRREVPLARVCTLLGSWSEGEPRSGHPWPAAYRLYEHQAEARLARELPRLSSGSPGGWNLPVTAGDEERLLASEPLQRRRGLIAIVADHFCMAESLVDLCRWRGYQTALARDARQMHLAGATAVLWDTTAATAADAARVASLRAAAPHAPLVALCAFPRPDEIECIRAAGVAAVVSKPFLLEDLFWQLDQVAEHSTA